MLWLTENLATVILSAVLVAIVTLIILHLVKNRRRGKSSCGCSCGSCPMNGSCHQKN